MLAVAYSGNEKGTSFRKTNTHPITRDGTSKLTATHAEMAQKFENNLPKNEVFVGNGVSGNTWGRAIIAC